LFLRFGISRSREYLADAGAAEMTKKPYALANALKKIDGDPLIEAVNSEDVAQLFIDNPQIAKKNFFSGLFDTHPPIEKRIQLLEQFV
jgi:heat shock protein HtpX